MQDETAGHNEAFVELVRDALVHLYDAAHLQTHLLVGLTGIRETSAATSGRSLRQALLDAIEAMRPGPGVGAGSRAWRTYRILELRYIEGLEVNEVIDEVALSSRQYYREHNRVLEAVASVLWKRWEMGARSSGRPVAEPELGEPTRLEAEHLLLADQSRPIDVGETLRGVAGLLRPLCSQRGVDLRLALPERLPTLWGNRVALRQALVSILAHAVEASEGEVTVVALQRGGTLEVRMTGRSAGRVDLHWLGEASRPFIETFRGSLEHLEGTVGPGDWALRLSFPTNDRPTLLVVDNDPGFIRLVERFLTGQEWDVVGAPDAEQALAIAAERRPRVVLLDVVIPGRDGWEVLQALKESPLTRDSRVVICSVLDEPSVAIALGAAAYLHKPIDQRQLLEALRSLL